MEPFKKVFYTNSPEETIELGRQIGSRLKGGEIIAYKGGLGGSTDGEPFNYMRLLFPLSMSITAAGFHCIISICTA